MMSGYQEGLLPFVVCWQEKELKKKSIFDIFRVILSCMPYRGTRLLSIVNDRKVKIIWKKGFHLTSVLGFNSYLWIHETCYWDKYIHNILWTRSINSLPKSTKYPVVTDLLLIISFWIVKEFSVFFPFFKKKSPLR